MPYYCYLIQNTNEKYKNYTYCGYTVNPSRRIKQHNEILKGGAKATRGKGGGWEFVFLITGFISNNNALSCEWRLKHPDGKRIKNKKYNGIDGRILSINEILHMKKWSENCNIDNSKCIYTIYCNDYIYERLTDLPNNIIKKHISEFI
jgi:predicted GIY-YIG superfamily endonuclease